MEMTLSKFNWRDWLSLTKPRICVMALWMTVLGYFLASKGFANFRPFHFTMLILGTALVGASCGILNQVLEIETDALMHRTQNRALVRNRIELSLARKWGLILGFIGELVLMFFVHPMCGITGAVTLLFYLGIYTPSKKITPLSTIIGAIPGALPALMGWLAVNGELNLVAWWLFSIVFIWQIPHFLAIAWFYQDDYGRASFPVLPNNYLNSTGSTFQALPYAIVLLPLVLLPSVLKMTGAYYFGAMVISGAFMIYGSYKLVKTPNMKTARFLFVVSIIFLPVLGAFLILDRV